MENNAIIPLKNYHSNTRGDAHLDRNSARMNFQDFTILNISYHEENNSINLFKQFSKHLNVVTLPTEVNYHIKFKLIDGEIHKL